MSPGAGGGQVAAEDVNEGTGIIDDVVPFRGGEAEGGGVGGEFIGEVLQPDDLFGDAGWVVVLAFHTFVFLFWLRLGWCGGRNVSWVSGLEGVGGISPVKIWVIPRVWLSSGGIDGVPSEDFHGGNGVNGAETRFLSELGAIPNRMGAPTRETGAIPTEMGVPPREMGEFPNDMGPPPNGMGAFPADMGVPPNETGVPPSDLGVPPAEVGFPPNRSPGPPNAAGEAAPAVPDAAGEFASIPVCGKFPPTVGLGSFLASAIAERASRTIEFSFPQKGSVATVANAMGIAEFTIHGFTKF